MKILPFYCALLLLVLAGCSKEKTDSALLDLDKKQLAANINYDKIFFYKFVKIAVRASAMQDTTNEQYQKFGKHMKTVVKCLSKANSGKDDISVTDAFLMYKDYLAVRSFVVETDEDSFPTFIEGIRSMHGAEKTITPLLIKDKKIEVQNMEHAALSMIVLATKGSGAAFCALRMR
jgi:hypothetical protein